MSVVSGGGVHTDGQFAIVNLPNSAGFDAPALAASDLNNDLNLDLVIGHNWLTR